MRTRLLLLLAALLTAALVVLLGGVLRDAEPDAGRAAAPLDVGATADRAVAGFGLGDTAGTVRRLEAAVKAEPQDRRSLGLLGLAYLQRTRETGDVAYYSLAERALRRALAGDARDPIALSGLASLAASRHEFRESLRFARRAVAAAPYTARGYGLVGDALLELGRYEQAFATFDRMVAIKPTLAGYARVAYARELTGRPRAAIEAMELALDAAGPPEPTAWTLVELGKLHFGLGETAAAGRSFRAALFAFPGYAAALDGLARVEAANGRLPRAIELQQRAVETVPLPHLVAQLGDLLEAAGREREARRAVRARRRDRPPPGRERRQRRPRDGALPRRPRHPAGRDGRRWRGRPAPRGPRSRATTPSPGRSPAPAAVTKRSRILDNARSDSAPRTPRSTSTAA